MGRRYLTKDEAKEALRRGRAVECFLGGCDLNGKSGVCYAGLGIVANQLTLRLYQVEDCGSLAFLDIYEFGPLDSTLGQGDADLLVTFSTLEDCFAHMDSRWPGSSARLVNEGVIQDEYRDYIASRSS